MYGCFFYITFTSDLFQNLWIKKKNMSNFLLVEYIYLHAGVSIIGVFYPSEIPSATTRATLSDDYCALAPEVNSTKII